MDQYGGYLGILKWTLAQNDGTKPSEVRTLSKEDQDFFENAVNEASISDASRMKKILYELHKIDIDNDESVTLIEDLEEFVENLDNAVDFYKLNGYQQIIDIMTNNACNKVKISCLSLIATASQNHHAIQKVLVDSKFLPEVIDLFYSSSDESMRVKSFGCLSNVINGYDDGERQFISYDGLKMIRNIICDDASPIPLIRKSLILLTEFVMKQSEYINDMSEYVIRCADMFIHYSDIDIKEMVILLINTIIAAKKFTFSSEETSAIRKAIPAMLKYCDNKEIPDDIQCAVNAICTFVK